MVYVHCKHKKTNEERIFTEPVFKASEHRYRFVGYVENPNGKPVRIVKQAEAKPSTESVVKPDRATPKPSPIDSVRESLVEQYKALTGKEPDKRWGVPKITEQIKELESKG